MRGAADQVRPCRAVDDRFRVGYELWWDHAPHGRRWWMVLVFDNDTAKTYLLNISGSMKATHVVGKGSWWGRTRDGAYVFRWGGSSADMAETPPGRSTKLVGLSGGPEVWTAPNGRVYDARPEVFFKAGRIGCSLPVPRLN